MSICQAGEDTCPFEMTKQIKQAVSTLPAAETDTAS